MPSHTLKISPPAQPNEQAPGYMRPESTVGLEVWEFLGLDLLHPDMDITDGGEVQGGLTALPRQQRLCMVCGVKKAHEVCRAHP